MARTSSSKLPEIGGPVVSLRVLVFAMKQGHLNKYVDEFSFRYKLAHGERRTTGRNAGPGRSREAPDLQAASLSGRDSNVTS